MSNGPRPMMIQGLQMTQTLRVCLATLITPVVRRSRDQRPVHDDEDEMPWRDPGPRR